MEGLYTTILHDKRKQLGLTINEYCFLDSVYHLSRKKGYCYKSKKNFAEFLGISERQVYNMIDKLIEKQLLIRDEQKFLYVSNQFSSVYEKISDMQNFHNDTAKISVDTLQKFQYDTEKISYNNNTNNNINNNNIITDIFEKFRKEYKGNKKGFETEFKNFKKHKDYENVIDLLIPAIENQSKWKSIEFELNDWTAQWKNLSTWINQRCWEDEPTEQVRNVITQRDKVKSIKISDVEAIYEGLNL